MKNFIGWLLGLAATAAFTLSSFFADAQIIPSIPYTLTNGSLADATQVMGNFNTIVTDVNASAATSGANTNITSLTGLTTPLSNTYGGTVIYTGGTTGGSANAQTLTVVTPTNFALTAGNIVTGIAGFSNSSATTLNVNAQGATAMRVENSTGLAALIGGEVVSGSTYMWIYDGTYLVLKNPSANVTNGQLAKMAATTFKANITGGSAVPTDVTYASVISALSVFKTVTPQAFIASGTYTPTTGTVYDIVIACGGGAGGGGAANSNTYAGGGGGGEVRVASFTAAQIGASQTVTLGGAANGGSAGDNDGTAGNNTTLGALLTANGGGLGHKGSVHTGGAGGAGGSGGVSITGQPGAAGTDLGGADPAGGQGGGSPFGGGGAGSQTNAGLPSIGLGYCAGGGGAMGSGGTQAGGNGTAGMMLILDFATQ